MAGKCGKVRTNIFSDEEDISVRYISKSVGKRKNGKEVLRVRMIYPQFVSDKEMIGISAFNSFISALIDSVSVSYEAEPQYNGLHIIKINITVSKMEDGKFTLTVEKTEGAVSASISHNYFLPDGHFM